MAVWSLERNITFKGASAMKTTSNKQSGFTLVELAIVLVIIGLIIGGVLVGQDLIKAATIRSSVSDLEKINAGATAFRGKYNGLPGDLTKARAEEFAFSLAADANNTGAAGLRDGNGVIEGGAANNQNLGGETALFWKDLGAAGFIAGTYPAIGTAIFPATAVTTSTTGYTQKAKLRDTASYYVYSNAGRNFFFIGGLSAAATTGLPSSTAAVTALEAKGLDEKIDDGAPTTGIVISLAATAASATAAFSTADAGAAAATTVCNTNATPSVYNVSSAATGASSNVVCLLQARTSF